MVRLAPVLADAPVVAQVVADVPVAVPRVVAESVVLLVAAAAPVVAVVVVAVADLVLRAPSGVREVRPSAGASLRSSAVKSLTRWRLQRLVAYASAKAMERPSG